MNRLVHPSILACGALLGILSSSGEASARPHSSNFSYGFPGGYGYTFADVAGDTRSDYVVSQQINSPGFFRGILLGTGSTDFNTVRYASGAQYDSGAPARVFTAHNDNDWTAKESICVHSDGTITCYKANVSTGDLDQTFTQTAPAGWTESSGVAVGRFSGTARDQIFVYNPSNGAPVGFFECASDGHALLPSASVTLGNLTGLNWPGGVQVLVASVAPQGGDDLVFFNETTRQVSFFGSHALATQHTFWWWYTSASLAGAHEEVTIADIDGDGLDDLALHDVTSGALRFFHAQPDATWNPASFSHATGQLPTQAQPGVLAWAKLKDLPAEGGNTNSRDDAMYYLTGPQQFERVDARWTGTAQTYWWAFTQNASAVSGPLLPKLL